MLAHVQLVHRALAGEPRALRELAELLSPVIQARVARVLASAPRRSARSIREEVLDFTQEVFVALFAERGRVLRGWDPERGSSLKNFVGIVAERQATVMLRSGPRNPFRDEPREIAAFDESEGTASGEHRIASRDLLDKVLARFERSLSPLGRDVFRRLYVDEQGLEEIQRDCGLSPEALYQWRSRLRKLARATLNELEAVEDASGAEARHSPEVRR
jgi:RNA polymerase sigma factor (sigma-70 family)